MGAEQYWRRAPLEECRDGLVEDHCAAIILPRFSHAAVYLEDSQVLESPCTAPAGLRNSHVESAFPTLKRGASEHCAYGAVART